MNKEQIAEWISHQKRIFDLIVEYEKGELVLSKNQVSKMWSAYHEINNKCPHPEKIESHYVSDHEDEYSQTHYSAHCDIICRYCNKDLQESQQYCHGTKCCITGDTIYFDDWNRSFPKFNLLLDANGKRTDIPMVYHKITFTSGYWEPMKPVPPPKPPAPPPKPGYLNTLEDLEKAKLKVMGENLVTKIESQYEGSIYD